MKFKDDLQKHLYYTSQIDYCYYMLTEVQKAIQALRPKNVIEAMVDEATGYNVDKFKPYIKSCKSLIKTIISCKEKLGLDASGDKEALQEILKL